MSNGLFYSKAQTLDFFKEHLSSAKILPLFYFSVQDWRKSSAVILKDLAQLAWSQESLIVRSSSLAEDQSNLSQAGHYLTLSGVLWCEIVDAIDQVVASFNRSSPHDQVLIQPCLSEISLSGVLFSHDPSTGAPYLIINYDDQSARSDLVTSGTSNALRTRFIHRTCMDSVGQPFADLIDLLQELETYCPGQALDIEFAIDQSNQLFLFQVRPLVCPVLDANEHKVLLQTVQLFIEQQMTPHPYLFGRRNLMGVMPDWNPAEIIGIRPRPLARTLYQELITDSIWAYQRDNYGYRNLRSFPLMLSLLGCPYIDVRVSFNSFLPSDLSHEISEKLLNYYLDALEQRPHFHDKVEFEIIFSCYTFDLPERLRILTDHGFSDLEIMSLKENLHSLTLNVLKGDGLWKQDLAKIDELELRWQRFQNSNMPIQANIYWLIEECKRYGTLPFAGLARAGFIAIQMLHSLLALDLLSTNDYQAFMQSLETVSSKIQSDLHQLSRQDFLEQYGHLRPGTYDILSYRYDERPELYFDKTFLDNQTPVALNKEIFVLGLEQSHAIQALLDQHGLNVSVSSFFCFIKTAIEGREYSKFIFSRHLSETLKQLENLGLQYDLSREELSFLNVQDLHRCYAGACDLEAILKASIIRGKDEYQKTQTLVLPTLITRPEDIWQFELEVDRPNFMTLKKRYGNVVTQPEDGANLQDAIVLIPQADPGYDWLFTHHIAGLITQYGGANSHMAIRACELGVPAVIGAGQVLFQKWQKARCLEIDCGNQQVRILA